MFCKHLTIYQNNDMVYLIELSYGGVIMPVIRKSAELRNNYGQISEFCHNYREPVFITKNGLGDLAIMSMETYDELMSRLELYNAVEIGMKQIENGEIYTEEEMMEKIRNL